jgi:hypothetical protein
MDGKEFYKYAKPCIEAQITIYPKPSNTGKYKIVINTRGREKVGDEIYQNESYIKSEIIRTPTGMKVVSIVVPSVYDKILELYKAICLKNKLLDSIIN